MTQNPPDAITYMNGREEKKTMYVRSVENKRKSVHTCVYAFAASESFWQNISTTRIFHLQRSTHPLSAVIKK